MLTASIILHSHFQPLALDGKNSQLRGIHIGSFWADLLFSTSNHSGWLSAKDNISFKSENRLPTLSAEIQRFLWHLDRFLV
jgi:hypothetical protein